MFGGSVVREIAISRRGDDTEWLRVGHYSRRTLIDVGCDNRSGRDRVKRRLPGYRRIPDDIIKLIVEGEYDPAPELTGSDSEGLERYYP